MTRLDATRAEVLSSWLDAEGLPGAGQALHTRLLSGGAQNDIYELRRGTLHAALRIPPAAAPATRDAGIVREWRIIHALRTSDVPHARAIALCTDTAVLGRTFYLTSYVDGWSPMQLRGQRDRRWPEPFDSDLAARAGLAYQLVDGIVAMGSVDWRAVGLHDLGRPDGFHERQVDRWTSFFDDIKGRDLPGMAEAASWLRSRKPIDYVPGLMHGDYQFANVMFADGAPATLAAIVDWEMGTIGDPKLDLAWTVHSWPADTSGPAAKTASYVDLTGMPTKAALVEHYAKQSGRQVDDMDYYCVLAKWKLAIMLEQGFQRMSNAKQAAFGPMVMTLMTQAAELAESSDYR